MNKLVCFEISFPLSIVNPHAGLKVVAFLFMKELPSFVLVACCGDGGYRKLWFREGH